MPITVFFEHDVADLATASSYAIPSPTVLFIHPEHLTKLASSILRHAQKSFIAYQFTWRHKVAGVREGFISKDSLWDRLVLDGARAKVLGEGAGTIRGVIVSGGTDDC